MAGNYPDPIGPRLPYDRDGSLMFKVNNIVNGPSVSQASATELRYANDETNTSVAIPSNGWSEQAAIGLMFPEPRDIMGYFISNNTAHPAPGPVSIETSNDTTNGIDGNWTGHGNFTISPSTLSNYRTAQVELSLTGISAIRFRWSAFYGGNLYALHLFGQPSTVTDRVEFWHPTLDQSLNDFPAHLDWGNRPRGTTDSRQVRLKNVSTISTANAIEVGMEALSDATPTYDSQHTFSYQGSSPADSVTIAALSPGQISDPITIEQTLLDNAALSLWAQRIYANVGSWS